MGLKTNIQGKLYAFAQKGRWQNVLVQAISAPLFWILTISATVRLLYYSILINTVAVDTASYLNYKANILKGETEGQRTPLYPYFIKFIGLFGQENLFTHVVMTQAVISFLGIILFYKIVSNLLKSKGVIITASLVYGMLFPVINFDAVIITESLSVSICLLFIYWIMEYLQRPTHLRAWAPSLLVFIAIMLRPSFVYLLPLMISFWALRLILIKKQRLPNVSGLAASLTIIVLLLGYSHLNERNAAYNGISVVSNNNEMAVIVDADLYSNGNDEEISQSINSNNLLQQRNPGKHIPGINIMTRFGPERIHRFLVNCIKNQPGAYAKYICMKMVKLSPENMFTNYANHKHTHLAFTFNGIEYSIFHLPFMVLYLVLLFDLILIITNWIKHKQPHWFKLFLWMLLTGQLMVAVIGGYSEYQRLILAALPAFIMVLFFYVDKAYLSLFNRQTKPIHTAVNTV